MNNGIGNNKDDNDVRNDEIVIAMILEIIIIIIVKLKTKALRVMPRNLLITDVRTIIVTEITNTTNNLLIMDMRTIIVT